MGHINEFPDTNQGLNPPENALPYSTKNIIEQSCIEVNVFARR
jgi:hypothetical protein